MKTYRQLVEKTLTPAEKKKREEIAKAMERENPGMDMSKKMAIATATAKRVAEEVELDEISLKDLTKNISLATGTKNIKKAMNVDKVKKDIEDMKARLATNEEKDKPDAVEVMRKKQQMANISASDKDKLAKIRAMLNKERSMKKEEVELDEEVLVEFVKVAMQHAKDAISKGMSHDDAKNHVYKQTMAHAKTKTQQGAGGMATRVKIDHALDKAEAHLAKHYGKVEEVELDEVSTEKLRDYASAALQDKNKAKADKRWKYAGKAMQKVADREVKAAHARKYNKMEEVELDEAEMSLYDKIKAARKNPSPEKPVRGRGSKNRSPKTYDVRNKLDKEDDYNQDLIKKRLQKNEEVELDEISKDKMYKYWHKSYDDETERRSQAIDQKRDLTPDEKRKNALRKKYRVKAAQRIAPKPDAVKKRGIEGQKADGSDPRSAQFQYKMDRKKMKTEETNPKRADYGIEKVKTASGRTVWKKKPKKEIDLE